MDTTSSAPSTLGEIRGVYFFVRGKGQRRFAANSPPGHLLHLVITGEVKQQCNGREYHLRPGDLLWYHDGESVEGHVLRTPWKFFSVIFEAPMLPPPDFANRLAKPDRQTAHNIFTRLHAAWNDRTAGEIRRALRCHSALSELILLHHPSAMQSALPSSDAWLVRLWWDVENQVRQNLGRPWTLTELAHLGQTSPATLHRASLAAVETPPVRRIKILRLQMASGLLIYSKASITEIAETVGYERINEFSRDMRAHYGCAPSTLRQKAAELPTSRSQ